MLFKNNFNTIEIKIYVARYHVPDDYDGASPLPLPAAAVSTSTAA
jgi:hypothetical protein